MHLLDRIRLHRQRKQTLNYIADSFLYEQQQAQMQPMHHKQPHSILCKQKYLIPKR
jgi:hypothetical protein